MKNVFRRALPVILLAVGLAAGFGAGSVLAQDTPKDITGIWKVKGWNAGKDKIGAPDYAGTVEVVKKGTNGCYHLDWVLGESKAKMPGIAVYDPKSGVIGAAYVMGGKPGVVLYRLDETGEKYHGLWTLQGALDKPAGHEIWRR